VVVSVVHRGMRIAGARLRPDCARDEKGTQHRHAVEEETELGGDVGRREEERKPADDQACTVAGPGRVGRLGPPSPGGPNAEREGDRNSGDSERVRPLRIEMALRLNARIRDGRAEDERHGSEDGSAAVSEPVGDDRQRRDGGKRGREAEKDEGASGTADEAGVGRLPENGRRQSPVSDEDEDRDGSEQEPNGPDFVQARCRPALTHNVLPCSCCCERAYR
jgi:hypothetical protein